MVITVVWIVSAVVLAAALGYYFAAINHVGNPSSSANNQTSSSSQPYRVFIVEPMDTGWNSTTAQPKFFVLGPNGLESTANISVPANTLIQLTIVSYDTPTPGSTDQQGKVTGTIGNNVYMINGTVASMTDVSMQWGMNVTSIPGSSLAHTFTIPSLGVNVPVVGGDTVMAYLRFDQKGVFQWLCQTPCGFGPNGKMGSMSMPGWMEGQITVT
jgi:heme/copper-type cytochrome/quinol oxidase subunit 2